MQSCGIQLDGETFIDFSNDFLFRCRGIIARVDEDESIRLLALDVSDRNPEHAFPPSASIAVRMPETDNGFFGAHVRGSCRGTMNEDAVRHTHLFEKGGALYSVGFAEAVDIQRTSTKRKKEKHGDYTCDKAPVDTGVVDKGEPEAREEKGGFEKPKKR